MKLDQIKWAIDQNIYSSRLKHGRDGKLKERVSLVDPGIDACE
jgi:hypothetical protein